MTDGEYIRALWDRARESLGGAEVLVAIDSNAAASRAYYAAFHVHESHPLVFPKDRPAD